MNDRLDINEIFLKKPYVYTLSIRTAGLRGGRVVGRCRVSCATGASN